MKYERYSEKENYAGGHKLSHFFFKVLLSLTGALLAILTIGTIIGLVRSPGARPLFTLGRSAGTEQTSNSLGIQNNNIRVYAGLGRLRIPLSNSSTMILTIAFPYDAGDASFMEEIAAKTGDLRAMAVEYFSSLPPERLRHIDEDAAKTEILRRYNTVLRLGRISTLYFSDMILIDGIESTTSP
jgi:flagellar basal body-associated protein FliL